MSGYQKTGVRSEYERALGDRLRAARTRRGLSLAGVEAKSSGRWKATVIGTYERAERSVTVAKLAELAGFYGVPVADLLPEDAAGKRRRDDVDELADAVARTVRAWTNAKAARDGD